MSTWTCSCGFQNREEQLHCIRCEKEKPSTDEETLTTCRKCGREYGDDEVYCCVSCGYETCTDCGGCCGCPEED